MDTIQNTNIINAIPYLYAYEFRRNCSYSKYDSCLSISSYPSQAGIPYNDPIIFAERMYNNPETYIGPSVDSIVMPIYLHISS